MRFSKSFIVTTKDSPKDAILNSHKYLIRAGYIQQVSAGIYNILPLGKMVLENIKSIVKKHMDKSGSQEVLMGFVTPSQFWKNSGRYDKYGSELLRFEDRNSAEFVLGPTHEEVVVELVKGFVKSYKQLPFSLYQIQTKFRDELRPRFGLIRGREFIMKDAYSFHSSPEDLDIEFQKMETTYRAIFDELGIDYRVVEADNGTIGGSGSKEFMLLAECGEDTLALCQRCDFASNIEVFSEKELVCPKCGGKIEHKKGIEIGHIFKLGDTYSRALNAVFLDQNGKTQCFVMGCYGIGISRLIAGIAEQKSDESGLVWGKSVAPYDVVIVVSNVKDCNQMDFGNALYEKLLDSGVRVLFDDRDVRYGEKMSDFELLGISSAIVVGKLLCEDKLEIIQRDGLKKKEIKTCDVMEFVK